jgi:hypothetical protein
VTIWCHGGDCGKRNTVTVLHPLRLFVRRLLSLALDTPLDLLGGMHLVPIFGMLLIV